MKAGLIKLGQLLAHDHTDVKSAQLQLCAVFVLCVTLMCSAFFFAEFEVPRDDQLRYNDYAVNLAQHGVYGLSGYEVDQPAQPSAANLPLYPGFVGLMSWLDEDLYNALLCAGTGPTPQQCATDYSSIFFVQFFFAGCSLFFIWRWIHCIFGLARFATLVTIGTFLSGELQDMAVRFLTENFVLTLFFATQFFIAQIVSKNSQSSWIFCGITLGLLALTRPEYLQFAITLAVVATVLICWRRQWVSVRGLVVGCLAFVLVLLPWSARNKLQLDSWSLTQGGYAEAILAYRLTFNRMSLNEWGASFVYWAPDVGDKLAKRFLQPASYERLISRNKNSFRETAITEVLDPLLQKMPREAVLGHMLRNQVFGDPVWFAATSVALFWRGIFVGKYWGIIGFFGYLWLLLRMWRKGYYNFAWLTLPLWGLVGLHALISPNVPRYNLPLISIYSLAWGVLLHHVCKRLWPGDLPAMLTKAS